MKIGIYVSDAKYPPEGDDIVSGHVQVPLKTAELLLKHGHEVTIITTEAPPNYRIPPIISFDGLEIETVRKIKSDSVDPLRVSTHFYDLRNLIRQRDFDLLHFFGVNKTAYLLGLIKASGIRTKALVTLINYTESHSRIRSLIEQKLFGHIDHFLVLTEYTKEKFMNSGFEKVSVTFPGVLKQRACDQNHSIKVRPEATDLVLFWRTASLDNGVDVCIEAFKKLSHQFELADLVFAVRAQHQFKAQFSELVRKYENIHLFHHPYQEGVTILGLLNCASCVVLPFRKLTMNPQLAVLETLAMGAPLVTTPVESNRELTKGREAVSFVEPSNVQQTYLAVKYLLENKAQARKMGEKAQSEVAKKWNWQVYEKKLIEVYEGFA